MEPGQLLQGVRFDAKAAMEADLVLPAAGVIGIVLDGLVAVAGSMPGRVPTTWATLSSGPSSPPRDSLWSHLSRLDAVLPLRVLWLWSLGYPG